jgi:Ca2+-binding RTX toxin-like protein
MRSTGSLSGTIDGRGGLNLLDYSTRSLGVRVNLLTNSATSTNGVLGIVNVTGSSGNDILTGNSLANVLKGVGGHDILVGNSGNDTINGGSGRDVIVGGTGSDNLNGAADDDLIIGGWTTHDANSTALEAIMNEWASNKSYATRLNNLRSGGGLNGTYRLVSSGSATVNDDTVADTLTGGQGLDWFFTGALDPFPLLDSGEQVN